MGVPKLCITGLPENINPYLSPPEDSLALLSSSGNNVGIFAFLPKLHLLICKNSESQVLEHPCLTQPHDRSVDYHPVPRAPKGVGPPRLGPFHLHGFSSPFQVPQINWLPCWMPEVYLEGLKQRWPLKDRHL